LRLGLCWWLGLSCVHACSSAPEGGTHDDASFTLRFKPTAGQRWREQWVYDLDTPGTGLVRDALTFDVTVARPEPSIVQLRQVVRRQHHTRNRRAEPTTPLTGTQITALWGADRSPLSEPSVEAASLQAVHAARALLAAARFGMLIEYPDQAVSVGDSWSIEPRTLTVGPGLSAVLRPSYSLEAIAGASTAREVVIGTDLQVDLRSEQLAEGVVMEGGGTASGTLRVRASDGVLLDARTILHFNQEVRMQGSETLGYREFSANTHVSATPLSAALDPPEEPSKLEPNDADEDRACASLLDAAANRIGGHALTGLAPYLLGALYAEALPVVTAAAPIRDPGSTLVLFTDGKRSELDGISAEGRELVHALRGPRVALDPLYVLAPATLPVERLKSVLALLPRRTGARLLVRTRSEDAVLPKATRWIEEQLHAALVAPASERQARMQQLLVAHLSLCEGALEVLRQAEQPRFAAAELPGRIMSELGKCGCTTTNVDGLELALQAQYGSESVRMLRLPLRLPDSVHGLGSAAQVQDLARSHLRLQP
jgi:hypothetical protein